MLWLYLTWNDRVFGTHVGRRDPPCAWRCNKEYLLNSLPTTESSIEAFHGSSSMSMTYLGCMIISTNSEDLCWERSCKSSPGSISWTVPIEYNCFCGAAGNQRVARLRVSCFWATPNYSVNCNELACQFQHPFPVLEHWVRGRPHTFIYYCTKWASQHF